jgi:hypothetical protein
VVHYSTTALCASITALYQNMQIQTRESAPSDLDIESRV